MVKKKFLAKTFQLKSQNEDQRRQESILNTLIWFSAAAFLIINIIRIVDIIYQPADRGLPIIYTLSILAFFIFLFWLSRRGFTNTASWLLIIIYSLPIVYSSLSWGADLPAVLLMSVLVITMSGVLLGSRWALINAAIISLLLLIITWHQASGVWPANYYWRQEPHEVSDAVVYGVLMIIISAVASLFARQINKALKRAKTSEESLKQERDLLEQRVAKRSEQLRRAHAEKLSQLYHLASLGRLSSGIFHDLVNPLTAISLNLEMIKDESNLKIGETKSSLQRAIKATHKMEGLITGIKKQIQKDRQVTVCSVNEEIRDAVEILAYKARKANVNIQTKVEAGLILNGQPIKLSQIIMNLLSNAIEASGEQTGSSQTHEILITALAKENKIEIRVSDSGRGISATDLPFIFRPFFSTKQVGPGPSSNLGLGLSSVKEIVEKNFQGQITVCSQPGRGSEFKIVLPQSNINCENKEY